jgi:hypothetical protein
MAGPHVRTDEWNFNRRQAVPAGTIGAILFERGNCSKQRESVIWAE